MSVTKKRLCWELLVIVGLLAFTVSSTATTIIPLSFSELVARADVVVEGVVVDLQVVSTGSELPRRRPASSTRSPQAEGETKHVDGEQPVTQNEPEREPQELAVEGGGRMLFTEVTLEVNQELVGSVGSRVTFRIAGGSDGQRSVKVFGMPSFKQGGHYVLFLGSDLERTGTPIVGVNQGFFEVANQSDAGQKVVLDYKGDYVLGIEDDQLIVRHNAERSGRAAPTLGPAPVPDHPDEVTVRVAPGEQRYWSSQEPPLSLEAFARVVRSQKEVQE